jgi:Flp pilus assembly pilin Flp
MTNNQRMQCNSKTGLTHDQRGLTTVEYVIVLIVIAVIAIGAWKGLGKAVVTQITAASASVGNLQN